jgi:chromosome segregation ATPase
MSRRLQLANLAGVLALAILCVVQWKRDRALNLDVNRLEKARIENEQTIAEQQKNLKGLNSDLAMFKEQLTGARTELSEAQEKLRDVETQNSRLISERDQVRESLTNWMNAVHVRDERLKEANASIQDLADRLNAAIEKYNELATNYNSVVNDLNEARQSSTNSATTRP